MTRERRTTLPEMAAILLFGGTLLVGPLVSLPARAATPERAAHDGGDRTETPARWYRSGQAEIARRRERTAAGTARNLVVFIGDGMSLATISAARILAGQRAGGPGEEHSLAFERFEHLALAKTYNTNQQTPDSAGTMTAMATGVKTFAGGIGVDQLAERSNCESAAGRERVSLLDLARRAGLATGIVTNSRITHATPAALYAKSPERRWEDDSGLSPTAREQGCRDIARQLVEYDVDGWFDVVFGGGRSGFLPAAAFDPEYSDERGRRQDGADLTELWRKRFPDGRYVWNREQFEALPETPGGPVLGLFDRSHMQYRHDSASDGAGEPSLVEMTVRALDLLQHRAASAPEADGSTGYVLVVESARIDHAHHAGNAFRALDETILLSEAVAAVFERVDPDETMIVVTADHGHALTFGGYGGRGNPILGRTHGPGPAGEPPRLARDIDGKPFTTLNYINGPGYRPGPRPDLAPGEPRDPDYKQEAVFGVSQATHGGEDVAVYATGPGAEALTGSIEQHLIFHALLQAQPALRNAAESITGESGMPEWMKIRD